MRVPNSLVVFLKRNADVKKVDDFLFSPELNPGFLIKTDQMLNYS